MPMPGGGLTGRLPPHRYKLRVLFNAVDMRWDWPVDVNYHEGKAFCAWKTEQDASEVGGARNRCMHFCAMICWYHVQSCFEAVVHKGRTLYHGS